jgi:Zn-dependent alcohol dehydrogenases
MRAARFYGPGRPLVIEDVPRPRPGPGEVVVKVKAAGVCHTELHFLEGVLNLGVVPVTLGHEIAGVVEEVGPGVGGA